MPSQDRAGQRSRERKRGQENAGSATARTPAGGSARSRAAPAADGAPASARGTGASRGRTAARGTAGARVRAAARSRPEPGRSLTVNIPIERAIDVAKQPVTAARRALSGTRGGLPVYVGLGVLAVADVIDPPLAAATGIGYAVLRRWGPLRPAAPDGGHEQASSQGGGN